MSFDSPKSIFITGANRGIGLELVKQYLGRTPVPKHLFAGYRTMSDDLKRLDTSNPNLILVKGSHKKIHHGRTFLTKVKSALKKYFRISK